MRLLRYSLLVALTAALLAPAASLSGPIEDCADDGQLQGNYSNEEKQEALKNLPSDLSEYSDCAEVLNTPNPEDPKAAGGAAGTGTGSDGAASEEVAAASEPTKADLARERRERAAIDDLANGSGKPNLNLDGKSISPGDAGLYDLASATHSVPLSIKLALYAVGLLTLAGLFLSARRRFPGLASGRLAGPLAHLSRVTRRRS